MPIGYTAADSYNFDPLVRERLCLDKPEKV